MKIYFRVETIRPDQRQFRQTSLELNSTYDYPVYVEIELDDEHKQEVELPADDYLGDANSTVINLAGLRELADKFDLVFINKDSPSGYNDEDDNDPDEWDE